MDNVLAILLAGETGSRLAPLTLDRTKPAVPFGGKYRIIDFTLANCLHSGIRRVLVLTHYKSYSLQKHLRDGWTIFNPELGEYITAVSPQMRVSEEWYQGTADAVFQNLYLLNRSGAEWFLVLSADHIYRMDYAAMLRQHIESGSDVTIACMEVPTEQAAGFSVLTTGKDLQVTGVRENTFTAESPPEQAGILWASMGVYIFSSEVLFDILHKDHLQETSTHDFRRDILPRLVETRKTCAYRFGGTSGRVTQDRYWCDIRSLDVYYEANMDLLKPNPPIDLYQPDWLIWTYQQQSPPARTVPGSSGTEGIFINSILAGGVVIAGGSVNHSILFPGVVIEDESLVEDSILYSGVRVGRNAKIRKTIIDKHVSVPDDEIIGYDIKTDRKRFTVTEKGIVIVPKAYRFSIRTEIP